MGEISSVVMSADESIVQARQRLEQVTMLISGKRFSVELREVCLSMSIYLSSQPVPGSYSLSRSLSSHVCSFILLPGLPSQVHLSTYLFRRQFTSPWSPVGNSCPQIDKTLSAFFYLTLHLSSLLRYCLSEFLLFHLKGLISYPVSLHLGNSRAFRHGSSWRIFESGDSLCRIVAQLESGAGAVHCLGYHDKSEALRRLRRTTFDRHLCTIA